VPDARVYDLPDGDSGSHDLVVSGLTLLLSVVPSVDTSTCHTQTTALEGVLQQFKGSITALTVSVDPPFAQARWKQSEECSAMRRVSDYKYVEFGERLGLYIESLELLTHAVFLVDKVGSFGASITLRTSTLSGSMG
jgi:thiol peroxidase